MAETRFIIDRKNDKEIWDLWERHIDAFWTHHDIHLTERDTKDWAEITESERSFLEHILSFFATADSIVNENLMLKLYDQIDSQAGRSFYSFQGAMETIHAMVYAMLLEGYVQDSARLEKLQRGDLEHVKHKIEWCQKWATDDMPVEERLLISCCVEGIFFSGAFCALYWLAQRGILPALCNSNKLIARDEGLHVDHGIAQYQKYPKVPRAKAEEIVLDALRVEELFINGAIECELIGMNRELMYEYIKHVSNNIFVRLGYSPLFKQTRQPFPFMARLCFDPKENFLEMRPYNYQRTDLDAFSVDADI